MTRAGRGLGAVIATLLLVIAIAVPGAGTAAESYRGKAAQALRCAAYIGLTAQSLREEGEISRSGYDEMMDVAVHILMEWVPTNDPIPALAVAMREVSSSRELYRRFVDHSGYCLATFYRA